LHRARHSLNLWWGREARILIKNDRADFSYFLRIALFFLRMWSSFIVFLKKAILSRLSHAVLEERRQDKEEKGCARHRDVARGQSRHIQKEHNSISSFCQKVLPSLFFFCALFVGFLALKALSVAAGIHKRDRQKQPPSRRTAQARQTDRPCQQRQNDRKKKMNFPLIHTSTVLVLLPAWRAALSARTQHTQHA
jgi:hypothetical protein